MKAKTGVVFAANVQTLSTCE